MKFRDLTLSYEAALHGVQSAILYEIEKRGLRESKTEHKHLRVGIDARAADACGLAKLLMDKGVFTEAEYMEYMRLAMNEELARYTDHIRKEFGLPANVSFG